MDFKPKILIVDDYINNIYTIEKLLADLDVEMIRSTSGQEAIEMTTRHEFALILMDIQMPGMDGFEAVEIIRREKKNEFVQIIFLTAAYKENYYQIKGIKSGAVDFITKPIIPDVFIGKVNIFVNLYRQRKDLELEIRRRAETEVQLQKTKTIAEEAARAKQQFLSTMSHEIRTPLNAIINTANLLRDEHPRPDQLDNIEILKFSADNLLHLINDILDFSKIDSGKIEFESVDFDLRKLLQGIRQSLEYQAIKKGLALEVNISDVVPNVVKGDSVRLTQILINLLGNAVKFTEQGKVSLVVEVLHDFGEEIECHFNIVDTGIGIPENKQQEIFDSFTQASSSTTRKYGGTGLGLAITKKLIGLQGGTLEVKSKPGEGSAFSFSLKFQKGDKNIIEDEVVMRDAFHSLKGLRVLVVEDNLVNQKIVSKFLLKWEALVDIAENGRIAVEKMYENTYDVVLMDLHMPEMNGYDATRTIRSMEGEYFKSLPIIALTASAFLEDRDKIYSHGMSGYIIKPFNPTELYWKISAFLK